MHSESFYLPRFPAGMWQGREQLHFLWALLALVSLLCRQTVAAATVTRPGAASSWQPLPAPHTSSSGASVPCWESSLGTCLISGSILLFLGSWTEPLGLPASEFDGKSH